MRETVNKTVIDLSAYPRRAHFEYFRTLQSPHVGVTVDVDVSALMRFCRARGCSFYLTMIHVAALAANRVPELRQRICGDGIVQYDFCDTSHTESVGDGTYCYCTLRHDMPFAQYIEDARERQAACRAHGGLEEDGEAEGLLFISTLPWLHYTALVQPTGGAQDSNPRITWGRAQADGSGRLMMPVSLLCHHALVDGAHLAAFYRQLDEAIAAIAAGGMKG